MARKPYNPTKDTVIGVIAGAVLLSCVIGIPYEGTVYGGFFWKLCLLWAEVIQ